VEEPINDEREEGGDQVERKSEILEKAYVKTTDEVQWNPVNTDTKGTGQNVRINGVSVLSGVSEKSQG